MKVEIITIGDELLLGQTVNTNAAWMGAQLTLEGLAIDRVVSISDTKEAICDALDGALSRNPIVLLTGGLGPTRDDITKDILADYFKTPLVLNRDVLDLITAYFTGRGLPMLEVNRSQAMLPESCEVLRNPIGTAQGMWFDMSETGQIVVSMPGVPYEMMRLMEREVIPRLKARLELPTRYHRTLLTQGVGESFLSDAVAVWEEGLAARGVAIAYLPARGLVRVRLSATSMEREEAVRRVEHEVAEFRRQAEKWIVSEFDEPIAASVGRLFRERGLTFCTAESCTGGAIAAAVTAIPGSSVYFVGGMVAYSNIVKLASLSVSKSDLERWGPVSEPVVRQMAEGARALWGTDYAIATSGIAGPDGGTSELPVGTVWFAISGPKETVSMTEHLGDDRGRIIERAVQLALGTMHRVLQDG